ncbi:uncharacterized protein LOC114930409 [Nylanderia fulva]|uniref:uncharacterized protein LOC114930409 n=1 Tax=Nylanderia fulva TaxID=613905 RepID=UPI0010FB9EF0|nr:uncharacterized protein LOC114930409 [Nylanderia fulva]
MYIVQWADARNNDAQMLRNEFEQNMQEIREWFQNGDIFIVDRGYRDAIPLLEAMGITHRMPCLLERDQRQFTTEQANESRIVTKTRWVVETRNGHLNSIFKFFANVIQITHTKNLGDFLRIAGGIINKYHPPIRMEEANAELARELLQQSRQVNVVQERVDAENLRVLRANWNRLNITSMSVTSPAYLRLFTRIDSWHLSSEFSSVLRSR